MNWPRLTVAVGATAIFCLTFAFRFLAPVFTNDHFMHLAEARQVLAGDRILGDFFDFGLPLQVFASAAAFAWSDQTLLGEALLTATFIAAGTALTFVVATRLTRSPVLGVGAALITMLSEPRLYNYPKVFFYVAAAWAAQHYARSGTRSRALLFGVVTGVAFLFRHDHGFYIGLAAIPFFIVLHRTRPREGVTSFAVYVAATLALVAPYLAFAQVTVGLGQYVADLTPGAAVSLTPRLNRLPLTWPKASPAIRFEPVPVSRVTIKWTAGLEPAVRRRLEQQYVLTDAIQRRDDTWSYVPGDGSRRTVRMLVNDPSVVDTNGINRTTSRIARRETRYQQLSRLLPILRLRLSSELTSEANALALFYYATLAIPVAALAFLLADRWRPEPMTSAAAATVTFVVALSLIAVQTLVRGSPDSRLPDVAAIVSVSGAWAASRILGLGRRFHGGLVMVTTVFATILWSVMAYAGTVNSVRVSQLLSGPSALAERARHVQDRLQQPLADNVALEGTGALARYAHDCMRADERLLLTWFEPMIYVRAERLFAGGMVFFDNGWFDSVADQKLTVARLQREQVRLAFVRNDDEAMFREYFPIVASYVDQHFSAVEPSAHAERISGYHVLVNRSLDSVSTYAPLGLPCGGLTTGTSDAE